MVIVDIAEVNLYCSKVFAQVSLLEVVVIVGMPGIDCVLCAVCYLSDGCSHITVLKNLTDKRS